MNKPTENWKQWGIRSGVVILFSLFGFSFSRLEGFQKGDSLALAVSGAVIASIALIAAKALRPSVNRIEENHRPKQFLGMKIMALCFVVALCGWLTAVFFSYKLGYVLVVLGIAGGFVSMLVHWFFIFLGKTNA